jgi:hypothetical protein
MVQLEIYIHLDGQMNHLRYILIGAAFILISSNICRGQNIFVLEKTMGGGIRMYKTNEHIKLKTVSSNKKIEGRIYLISDSSLVLNYETEIMLDDIAEIYRSRHMFRLLQTLSLTAGLLYLSISTLNGLINNDNPIVPEETLKISGGLLIAGVLLTPLTTRVHKIKENKWKVKILDFTD